LPTLEDRKFELKQKRSDALMAKINVLRARDGSVAPPIASMKEEDAFNLGLLFGASRNENINWNAMGVEGLIRCYYEIIYKLNGKVRNNIIKVGTATGSASVVHNTTNRSGLQSAVSWLSEGQAFKSGFYVGWDNLDTEANEESNMTKKQRLNNVLSMGRKGDLDVPMTDGWTNLALQLSVADCSTSFTSNQDPVLKFNSTTNKVESVAPDNNYTSSILYLIDNFNAVIGAESPKGPHILAIPFGSIPPDWTNYTNDTLLGKRHRDVAPYQYTPPSSETTTSGGGTDSSGKTIPTKSKTTYIDGSIQYGNNTWDTNDQIPNRPMDQTPYPSNYTPTPDFWDSNYETSAQTIISRINDIITYINFTKITNFTYLVNHRIVPGIDPAYNPNDSTSNIGTSWSLQNDWVIQLTNIKNRIQQSIDFISQHKNGSNTTKIESRVVVDIELFEVQSLIAGWKNTCSLLANTVDSLFGDVRNPLSLVGHRFLWIRTLIHAVEGTMTAINSTTMAIDFMNKKLKKSEDELYMFGILEDEFIPTPLVVGVEPYPVLNAATFEMEIGGWLVAWGGQEHCTGYDVWKSDDYNPATKNGTWKKIEASHTQYTMSDVNANTGKVFTYIIDTNVPHIPNDVDPATVTHPYYRVKAYDQNGGLDDYSRKNATSMYSDPLNPAAFPLGGAANAGNNGPRTTPSVTTTDAGPTIPSNTLFWVTNHNGGEAEDFERRVFKSEAPYDSIASNLIVFVDGKFKNQGAIGTGDYSLIDTYKIRFHESIPLNSEVNLVVGLRSFSSKNDGFSGGVDYYNDLLSLTGISDGDIYKVEVDPANTYWQWSQSLGAWNQISNPSISSSWKEPVNTFTQLPTTLNADGDIRLVLDTSIMFRWSGSKQAWMKVSGSTGGGWLTPIDTTDDLDDIDQATLNNGTIVFVISEESLFRWSIGQKQWIKITGSGSTNWKNPVNIVDQLPKTGNTEGDIRLVLTENKIYRWFAWEQEWKTTRAEADMAHTQLNDLDWEAVDDHDVRYYPKEMIDDTNVQFEERLKLLELLKPKDAEPLSGDFDFTGTRLYEGYLSTSDSILRYENLRHGDYFNRIIKDASFILSNTNTQQFRDADKGKLYCLINNITVDEFNLAEWFDESKRESGQVYPRKFGLNNIIEILSVGPYNQYATYQRADFQLNISPSLLKQGENKIQLIHELMNQANDIYKTDEVIIFWDEFDGNMGFKEIYLDEVSLVSNKYLSGIRYYSLGDKFRLRFEAENLFNNTYTMDKQIYIGIEEFAITPKYVNYKDVHVLGQPEPRIGENIFYLEEMTLSQTDIYNSLPTLKLQATNPFTTYTQNKNNTNFLINTIDRKATDKEENFVDEYYRLPLGNYTSPPSQINGVWNSSNILTTSDLQIFNGRLIYPSENFSKYKPTQTANYSTFTGPKSYIRAFKDIKPHNNGKFFITNYRTSDPNIKIEIKLPGQTGWLNLGKLYNVATFTGIDGDGCLITNTGEKYEWTSGEFSMANSDYMVMVRVTLYAKTNYISLMKLEW